MGRMGIRDTMTNEMPNFTPIAAYQKKDGNRNQRKWF